MKTGERVRWRRVADGLPGRGRSIKGIAGSVRPRMVNGEMSDAELGEPRSDFLFSGVELFESDFALSFMGSPTASPGD